MKQESTVPAYNDIARREAADWFVVMHDEQEPPPAVLQRWLEWMEASEGNQRAFEDIASIWHGATVDVLESGDEREDDYDGSVPVSEWRESVAKAPLTRALSPLRVERGQRGGDGEGGVSKQRSPFSKQIFRFLAYAASLAAIVLTGWLTFNQGWFHSRLSSGEFTTKTGEHMQLLLADGSRVTLGGRSRLTIDFTANARRLRLESGEAFFDVRKDPRRPFTVSALDGEITAIGTAFNVRAIADRVTVSVSDGMVQVTEDVQTNPAASSAITDSGADTGVRVARGQQVSFNPHEAAPAFATVMLKRIDPAESARWRDGWLIYRHERLRYVIADIARYTDLKLEVADSAADLYFTGAIFKDRISEWINALPAVAPVTVANDGGHFTITAP